MVTRFKIVGLFWAIFFTWQAQAEITLRVYIPDVAEPEELNLKIPMTSSGTDFNLEFDLPENDGTSISDAAKTYVPILGTDLKSEASIFSLNGNAQADDLPQVTAGTPPDAVLTFEKEITVTSGNNDLYLHAAVANKPSSDDWRVIGLNTDPVPPTAQEQRHKVSFNLTDFCDLSDITDCSDLVGSNDALMTEVYFFMAESELQLNSEIDPTDSKYNHGVFYEIHMSSNLNDSTIVDILDVKRGDGGLTLKYRSNQVIDNFDRVIAVQYKDPSITAIGDITPNEFLGDYSNVKLFGNSDSDPFPARPESSVFVEPLTNGEEAFLSIAFVDKFKFVTPLSNPVSETPLEIEVLLQEQSCFFFTAGFGREHRVIDELKKFRDQVLKQSPIGRVIVDVYYAVAPKYAPYILDSPWLQAAVRGIGHVLVFLIQSYMTIFVLLGTALFGGLWAFVKRKGSFQYDH